MIFINAKMTVKDAHLDSFLDQVSDYTEACRAEEGNLWFEWYRSTDEPNVFLLSEGFTDEGAQAHVKSEHFKRGLETMRPLLAKTPDIISRQVDGNGWDKMGELQIDER